MDFRLSLAAWTLLVNNRLCASFFWYYCPQNILVLVLITYSKFYGLVLVLITKNEIDVKRVVLVLVLVLTKTTLD